MYNTKDVLIEALKALGLVAVFFSLLFAPEIYKALTTPPKPKLGHATPFGIKPTQNHNNH